MGGRLFAPPSAASMPLCVATCLRQARSYWARGAVRVEWRAYDPGRVSVDSVVAAIFGGRAGVFLLAREKASTRQASTREWRWRPSATGPGETPPVGSGL